MKVVGRDSSEEIKTAHGALVSTTNLHVCVCFICVYHPDTTEKSSVCAMVKTVFPMLPLL